MSNLGSQVVAGVRVLLDRAGARTVDSSGGFIWLSGALVQKVWCGPLSEGPDHPPAHRVHVETAVAKVRVETASVGAGDDFASMLLTMHANEMVLSCPVVRDGWILHHSSVVADEGSGEWASSVLAHVARHQMQHAERALEAYRTFGWRPPETPDLPVSVAAELDLAALGPPFDPDYMRDGPEWWNRLIGGEMLVFNPAASTAWGFMPWGTTQTDRPEGRARLGLHLIEHPEVGPGMLMLLDAPLVGLSVDGVSRLNALETLREGWGPHVLGSWALHADDDAGLVFAMFLPDALAIPETFIEAIHSNFLRGLDAQRMLGGE